MKFIYYVHHHIDMPEFDYVTTSMSEMMQRHKNDPEAVNCHPDDVYRIQISGTPQDLLLRLLRDRQEIRPLLETTPGPHRAKFNRELVIYGE